MTALPPSSPPLRGGDDPQLAALADVLSSLPRAQLGIFPTPLHQMPSLGRASGSRALYVKRDDLAGLALGGNKVRSLEFLMGQALACGVDTLICGGGVQSNMCRLAAAAAAKLGLRCVLVHNDHQPNSLQGNDLLNRLLGAVSIYAGPMAEKRRDEFCRETAAREAAAGRRPYIVEHGGSTPLGSLGYVAAAVELRREDIRANLDLRHVVIVGAMGGTAAGLIAGLSLLAAPYRVHVISVEYEEQELTRRLELLTQGAVALLKEAAAPGAGYLDRQVPAGEFVTLHFDYLGPGYGQPTAAGQQALLAAARQEALLLEPIYTAKTLAGCLDLIERGVIGCDEPCCFWHTGGTGALFALTDLLKAR